MKRFICTIVFILLECIVVSFGLTGCSDDGNDNRTPGTSDSCNIENYDIIVETTLYSGIGECNDFVALCKSLNELHKTCIDNGYDFFNKNPQENSLFDTVSGEIIRNISNKEFEESALVVCGFYCSSDPGQYHIDGIEVKDKKLTLYMRYPGNDTANDVECYMFFAIQLNKTIVSNVENTNFIIQ